ncbi:hypothetical protein EV127DRAFT_472894 [Xylaria flabelliformis]|nr:hypothetical protein EV127DRAFT_472894 [Xylaria flabelliformis]
MRLFKLLLIRKNRSDMAPIQYADCESAALVEQFSIELETRESSSTHSEEWEQLRAGLIEERKRRANQKREELKRIEEHFSSRGSEDTVLFSKAQQELRCSIKDFHKYLPNHLKLAALPKSWSEVELAMSDVEKQWDSRNTDTRIGQANGWVRRMCNGLNNHATVLKLLPAESEYTSLISGAITMFMKASATHVKITEAFAEGISDINDAVKIEHASHIYNTPALRQLTMRLYAHIFSYLSKCLAWWTSRSRTRFLKSFNENILDIFEADRKQVKKVAHLMSEQIQRYISADVRASKLLAEETYDNINYLIELEESAQEQSRMRDAAQAELIENIVHSKIERGTRDVERCLQSVVSGIYEKLRGEFVGTKTRNLLMQQSSMEDAILNGPPQHGGLRGHISPQLETQSEESRKFVPQKSAYDIRLESRHLEDYFNWEHVYPFEEPPLSTLADPEFVTRLNTFTAKTESQMLYVCRRYLEETSNPLKMSAAVYISLARKAEIPVISYFCRLSHDEPPSGRTRETIELSGLLCSMIRQLINILPGQLAAEAPRLDLQRFSEIDGTLRTWKQAISLLGDLVVCVRLPLLLFVLDGLSLLEYDSEDVIEPKLRMLIICLKNMVETSKKEGRIVKILFTTAGLSGALCQELEEEDVLVCEGSSPYESRNFRRSAQPQRSIQEPNGRERLDE